MSDVAPRLVCLADARKRLGGAHPSAFGVPSIGKGRAARWDLKAIEARLDASSMLVRSPLTRAPTRALRQNVAHSRKGFVYFVQGATTGAIKIGFTVNPKQRVASLQSSAPEPLCLLGSVPGDENLERVIHSAFAESRLRGEWFRPSWALLEFIKLAPVDLAGALDDIEATWKRAP